MNGMKLLRYLGFQTRPGDSVGFTTGQKENYHRGTSIEIIERDQHVLTDLAYMHCILWQHELFQMIPLLTRS